MQSAYPDLSPNIATAKDRPKAKGSKDKERDVGNAGEASISNRGGACALKSQLRTAREESSGGCVKRAHQAADESQQDANAMSVSIGNDVLEQQTSVFGSGLTSVGSMIWEGLDGERVSPRHFHRKRTDLTSRGQVRMGYGICNKESVLNAKAPAAPSRMLGEKTLRAKRAAQQRFAADIAAATMLQRPKTPQDMPIHSGMPMNRPKENNWAFQTIFLPKTMSHWNSGNVSKNIRNMDYERERPTFGPHFSSN